MYYYNSLNVRVLLLVRDPRGTMQSRKHKKWCPGNPDCEDPARLCRDLVDDHKSVKKLLAEFPTRYKVVRYEDFSMDPLNNTIKLFKFFGFSLHDNVTQFLDTHTKTNMGNAYSTFRDSKTAPFHWLEQLNMSEVERIQSVCGEAMRLWGYRLVHSEEDLKTFHSSASLDLGHWDIHSGIKLY